MRIDDIKKIMLGHLVDDVEIVIITPLKSTYKILKERLDIKEIYENVFFENCIFNIKEFKKGIVVLSPQGIAAKDIIELFKNVKILFFGLAGSLNSELQIGSLVQVDTAIYQNDSFKLTTIKDLRTVKCGYSPCLLGEIAERYCKKARNQNCNVVDMEVAVCAMTAIKNKNKFLALLLISDIPGTINFWEVPEDIQIVFTEKRKNAIEKIINYINVLI